MTIIYECLFFSRTHTVTFNLIVQFVCHVLFDFTIIQGLIYIGFFLSYVVNAHGYWF